MVFLIVSSDWRGIGKVVIFVGEVCFESSEV